MPMPSSLYGSDVIVELLRRLDIQYAAFNPGATFRGIHDSLVNFPAETETGNSVPEVIQCLHEEISVALAHGYAKAAGKPMAVCLHDIVGLQHGSMAIYNAWCDRAPILLLGGGGPMDLTRRRPWIDWIHTALVQGSLVRDYVKWDDQPANLASVPESLLRAYRVMLTDPPGPVYVCFDADIQEDAIDALPVLPDTDRYAPPPAPLPEEDRLEELAERLVQSDFPVLVAEFLGREPESVSALAELAEVLGAPVLDHGSRFNFPSNHPMDFTGAAGKVLPRADFVLALDTPDLFRALTTQDKATRESVFRLREGCRIAHISIFDLSIRAWSTDYQRLPPVDFPLGGSAARAVTPLVRMVREKLEKNAARREAARDRFGKVQAEGVEIRRGWVNAAREAWTETPIALPRLAGELWRFLKEEDWVLTNGTLFGWERRMWDFNAAHRIIGHSGAAGLGYGMGASIGAALAHRGSGRLCVNLQADGDLLYTPSALWTAVHHEVPLLTVVVNNRTYYNSEEHALAMAGQRDRPAGRAGIGTRIEHPSVNFPRLAESFGLAAFGPVEEPDELAQTLEKAIAIVKTEQRPAVVDVVTRAR